MTGHLVKRRLFSFLRGQDGSITVLSMLLFVAMLLGAGFAIDVNNAMRARYQLQGAADAAGHAAMFWRFRNTESASIAKGVEIAEANMPTSLFGTVLASADVEFGDWDRVARTFTVSPGDPSAVRVTLRRNTSRANAVRTFLLKLIGQDELDLTVVSVWDAEDGFCPPRDPDKKRGEGFFAVGRVDMQTSNDFKDGFCVHSDTHVEMQNHNDFELGVTVSMPNENNLVIPSGGMQSNPGLPEALTSIDYNLTSFFDELPNLASSYWSPGSTNQPTSVTSNTVNTIDLKGGDKLLNSMLDTSAVNVVECKNGKFQVAQDEVLTGAVVVTDCEISFLQGSAFEDGVLVTTNTSKSSINGPKGVRFGKTTFCSDGAGGATVITMGGIDVASKFQAYGANVIADGDMKLSAQAAGLAGINVMSGGQIDIASNSDFGFCSYGPPEAFRIPVVRMVM